MPLPRRLRVHITPENAYAVLDEVGSDEEYDLYDCVQDSDTEFDIEDEETSPDAETEERDIPFDALCARVTRSSSESLSASSSLEAIPTTSSDSSASVQVPPSTSSQVSDKICWTADTKYIKPTASCDLTGKVLIELDKDHLSPLSVFEKVLDLDVFLEHIKTQSELYAAQQGHIMSKPLTIEELKAFIAVNFIMSYHKVPSTRNYWAQSRPTVYVECCAKVMPRDRFFEILKVLHFSDNDKALPRDDPKYDRAYKVRWLITYLNARYQLCMENDSHQSIDEKMIKFKGRNIMRQYVKNKPIKWGFKNWFRCDARTGYVYEFDVYTGRKDMKEVGLGEGVVLQLTKRLEDTYCKVFFDNFFTSPRLLRELAAINLYGSGVVRKDRKLLPLVTNEKKDKQGRI